MKTYNYLILTLIVFYSFLNIAGLSRLEPVNTPRAYDPKTVKVLDTGFTNLVKNVGASFSQLQKTDRHVQITISAAGDCTIGTDVSFGYTGSFTEEADKSGYTHFFNNVRDIFASDDLTIVNLETTFTDSDKMAEKKFRFKGAPSYTAILQDGSIEAVNIANNHIYDYLDKGYEDTISSLKEAEIGYFGFENKYIVEIKGIKVGCLGYTGWNDNKSAKDRISKDIKELKEEGVAIIIVSFHWGNEREYKPNSIQKSLGRHAIDSGADLVLGHHPHVVQGIELYNGKSIVYSLGNFSFGGNRNPSDKDTFIFQQTFEFMNDAKLETSKTKVIPCSISSINTRNNFQPIPLEGDEADRVLKKIEDLSSMLSE